jgi:hypothetical protein
VTTLDGRELHLVKKALAIAVLAIERQPGPFQSMSDQADMKAILDHLITSSPQTLSWPITPVQPGSLLRANRIERELAWSGHCRSAGDDLQSG